MNFPKPLVANRYKVVILVGKVIRPFHCVELTSSASRAGTMCFASYFVNASAEKFDIR